MKKGFLLLFAIVFILNANENEDLAVKHCGGCHVMGVTSKEKLDNMKAPPYWALAKKAREHFDTQQKQLAYIVDYALNPSEDKMLFPKATIEKFGHMPPLDGKIAKDDVQKAALYILQNSSL